MGPPAHPQVQPPQWRTSLPSSGKEKKKSSFFLLPSSSQNSFLTPLMQELGVVVMGLDSAFAGYLRVNLKHFELVSTFMGSLC